MNKPPSTSRLFKFGRAQAQPVALDAADLGTCFGLEVSLDQADEEPAVLIDTPRRSAGWLRRLSLRQRPPG